MKRFIVFNLNFNKFERKNCISKICLMKPTIKLLSFLVLFFIAPQCIQAQTEITSVDNIIYLKLGNAMNAVLTPFPEAPNTEITLYFKVGSQYESDSLKGLANIIETIIAEKLNNGLHNSKNATSLQGTSFEALTTSEHITFKFTTAPANLVSCLTLLKDSVFDIRIREKDIKNAITKVLMEIEAARYDNKKLVEDKIIKALYGQDHAKVHPLGDPDLFPAIGLPAVTKFYEKYFVPNNAIFVVTGNSTANALQEAFPNVFRSLIRSEFDPGSITKIINMRPMTYSSQFVFIDSISNPEFEIYWQFPGTRSNIRASRNAFLLTSLMNDKNNFIQAKAAKMGCKKFQVEYEANNFSGVFKITIQPSKEKFFPTYHFVINEMNRLSKTLLNETMINASKLQFAREYAYIKKTKEYPHLIVKNWAHSDNSFFLEVADSIKTITEKEFRNFVIDYIEQSPHVTVLRIRESDRKAMNTDSVFTDVDENVKRYVFRYKQNITEPEGEDNAIMLRNLTQWLRLNTDVNVQVNGFSDEGEYNKITDDSIMQFIDSLPTFKKSKQDIIKKGYLRPEMMRAMKVIKYLYDHGIAAERLSGTSMVFSSANKKEEEENMKCNVTLDKYRKTQSLFEFHYGKKE